MSLLYRALEHGLNLPFRMNPGGRRELEAVSGRVVRMTLTAPAMEFDMQFQPAGVRVHEPGAHYDVKLSGSVGAFVTLLDTRTENTQQTVAQGIRIEGDVDCALAMRKAFARARMDWQEVLARALGDVPGQLVALSITRVGSGLRDAGLRLAQNGVELLQEERRVLPRNDDVEGFLNDVDTLRNDVERLAKRVELLRVRG